MRHGTKDKKFSRRRLGQRRSFLRNLAGQLIEHERIETTVARARVLRPRVEKMITLAKKQTIASLRLLMARLPKDAATKLYYEVSKRYGGRTGGYLRIIKGAHSRKRDGAEMALIEFVK